MLCLEYIPYEKMSVLFDPDPGSGFVIFPRKTGNYGSQCTHLYSLMYSVGRVKNEKIQLGITAICFFGTILYGETEFTALSMF